MNLNQRVREMRRAQRHRFLRPGDLASLRRGRSGSGDRASLGAPRRAIERRRNDRDGSGVDLYWWIAAQRAARAKRVDDWADE